MLAVDIKYIRKTKFEEKEIDLLWDIMVFRHQSFANLKVVILYLKFYKTTPKTPFSNELPLN